MSRARGFTLVEMLAVVAILLLLMTITVVGYSRYSQSGHVAECESRLLTLGLLVDAYADRHGAFPPSRLAAHGVGDANAVNEGIEALVAAFWAADHGGRRPPEEWLVNTDGDRDERLDLAGGGHALNELADPWDNPLVYLHHGDYGGEHVYRLRDLSGAPPEDVVVRAARNPLTETWVHFDGYQLGSAGPDGIWDTADDIRNFEVPNHD